MKQFKQLFFLSLVCSLVFFTNCGKEGNLGPSQQDCDAEYSGTDLEGHVDVVDGIQEWIVPQSGLYTIEAWGAQGGAGTTNGGISGGLGAYIKGEFNLTAGMRMEYFQIDSVQSKGKLFNKDDV